MPKPPTIHRRITVMSIRVGLDPAEREPLTHQLTTAIKAANELRIEAANVAAGYREKIKDCTTEINDLVVTLEQGRPEDHEVEEIKDFKKNLVTIVRTDTRAVVEKREMTEADHQLELGGPVGKEEQEDDDRE